MIINADDFGYSSSVNEAICECFNRKLINRTTIMVNMPCTEEAARLAKENGFFDSVGLHINLVEGKALTKECANSPLCDENGYFKGTFHKSIKARLYLKKSIRKAIASEVEAQMRKFFDMGFTLHHADSHQYTHVYFSVYMSIKKLLQKYGFISTRISRNIPENDFSPAFKVYKTLFNFAIRRLRVNGKQITTTEYFGSVQDFEQLSNKEKYCNDIEFMTHPEYVDGMLTDITLPNPHPFKDEVWLRENHLYLEDVSGKKKKLLITFIQTHIGGAMTALVNFLNALDTEKYDVDVIFYKHNGQRHGIKDEINILPQGRSNASDSAKNILMKGLSPSYLWAKIREAYYLKIKKNKNHALQIMSKQGARYDKPLRKEYDVVVAYEFSWPLSYAMEKVNAKEKICWFHIDFDVAGYSYKEYKKYFDKASALVFVSDECREKFAKNYPMYKDKVHFMPNLLTAQSVRARGEENIELPFEDKGKLTFVSVARVNFYHKGFDRAANVFNRLKADGLLDNVKWIVIGKGRDSETFEQMVHDYGLEDVIFTVGLKKNPIPYLKYADAFLLPSRFEGKPMVVTEAFIMGLPAIVTEYASANEQIRSGVDGLVFENSEEGLYAGLKNLLENPKIIDELKENVANTDYGNEYEIAVFDNLIDQIF